MIDVLAVTAGIGAAALVAAVGLVVLVVRLLDAIDRGSGEDDTGGAGGGGGGGVEPPPRPGGDEPGWWPEFERDFETYVAARDRGQVAA